MWARKANPAEGRLGNDLISTQKQREPSCLPARIDLIYSWTFSFCLKDFLYISCWGRPTGNEIFQLLYAGKHLYLPLFLNSFFFSHSRILGVQFFIFQYLKDVALLPFIVCHEKFNVTLNLFSLSVTCLLGCAFNTFSFSMILSIWLCMPWHSILHILFL